MMGDQTLSAYINEHPVLQSLLYDINLLPEQLERDSRHWGYMLAVVRHWQLQFERDLRGELQAENANLATRLHHTEQSAKAVEPHPLVDEYEAWIRFFNAGNGDYHDFLRSMGLT